MGASAKLLFVAVGLAAMLVSVCGQILSVGHVHVNDNYMFDYRIYNSTVGNANVTSIEFSIMAVTKAWVGIGISNNGTMTGADIYIAGVNGSANNAIYSGDYHGVGQTAPVLDATQNWNNISVTETANTTLIKVNRLLNTGDAADDVIVEDKNQYFIWAYGVNDTIAYHQGSQRGAVQFNFFKPPTGEGAGSTFSSAIVALVIGLVANILKQ